MPGFSGITGDESIMFADNASFDGTKRGGKMTTNGELFIGSTAAPHVRKGTLTSVDGSIAITAGPGTINLATVAGVNDLHVARFIVSAGGITNGANFTTIASALTAATSAGGAQTIFIQPGTYTENLTLVPGINLAAFDCDAQTPNVTINGTCTLTTAGTVSISGIRLQTNGAFALAVTGAAASIVRLKNCFIAATNNTGISFTSSSASAQINLEGSNGDLATTGIGLYSKSSPGILTFSNGTFTNSGGSTTQSTSSAGLITFSWGGWFFPISILGTAVIILQWCFTNTTAQNVTSLTTADTAQAGIYSSSISSGSASAVNIGANSFVNIYNDVVIESSNTNAITGAGTVQYGTIFIPTTFSQVINVATQNPLTTIGGGWSFIRTLTASSSATLDFTTLPVYPVYALVITHMLLATTAQQLLLRISNDNGSSFAATGYTAGVNYTSYNAATVTNVNATTSIPLTSAASTGIGISGTIFFAPMNSNVWGQTTYLSTTSGVRAFGNIGGGGNIVPNAFRLLSSSGNLAAGIVTLYGLKQ